MRDVQREILEPFNPKGIKSVNKGAYSADYVSWTDKIQRLYMLGVDWDWQIVAVMEAFDPATANAKLVDTNEPVAVHGRLTVRWFQDGPSSNAGMHVRTIDGLGQGSDVKKASTDAFSRACAFLGLGLHLWCQSGDRDGGYWITKVLDRETPQQQLNLNDDDGDDPKAYGEDDPERPF